MQTRSRNIFTSIHTEGSLLPPDLLQRVLSGDKELGGLAPADYHLAESEKLNEAINRSWNRLQGAWAAFQTSRNRLSKGDPGTTLTRERWLLPLFQELNYGRLAVTKAIEIEGKPYPISHGWEKVPIHLVGCGVDLDSRTTGVAGASRSSPHSLVQELLNVSDEHLWGIVSNGLRLRILRDNLSLTRQAFLEFDLEELFEGEIYSDFVLLWLFCHQSRFETIEGKTEGCWLEKWSKAASERGTRALDQLRNGVEEAITALGCGFLAHPHNQALRKNLHSGELDVQDFYRQLLRQVYRLIFLFVAEDRDLLLDPQAETTARDRYMRYYSTARLRHLAERRRSGRHADLWQMFNLVTDILGGKGKLNRPLLGLGLPVLNGFLFSDKALPDLEASQIDNQSLLNAVRSLAFTTEGSSRRAVDYKNLGPEELGSVYESLLELHPIINSDAGTFELTSASGHERKTTGSYYTPSSLIQVLLDSALNPVIEQAIKNAGQASEAQQAALLDLKVCDPACGSGHFLIAAANRIARRVAQIQSGGDEPPPIVLRSALRQVIAHCIYAVDVNPMAVELCKVSLWLESIEPGKPLSFLDAHIQCGDSLVGVSPGLDIREIPDEAFDPAFGDDKTTAAALKKRNKRERGGQLGFRWKVTELTSDEDLVTWMAQKAKSVDSLPEDSVDQVQSKADSYHSMLSDHQYQQKKLEYDLWIAAFFWFTPKNDAEHMIAPTQQELVMFRSGRSLERTLVEKVRHMSEELHFFHWELVFPHVFNKENPGFDCVLGNPPWERIKLQEQEFFASSDHEIARAPNKTARQKLIDSLPINNPALASAFVDAKHVADASSKFVRSSSRFPLTGIGDVNTYALFSETIRIILSSGGRAGFIVPSGLAIDNTTKDFFGSLVSCQSLESFFEFENEGFFSGAGQGHMIRFALTTIVGKNQKVDKTRFLFQGKRIADLSDIRRVFSLSPKDIYQVNPNTKTCPIFQTHQDAEITKTIYSHIPVLMLDSDIELESTNPWGIRFLRMFDSANDSDLFKTKNDLITNGYALNENYFLRNSEIFIPLYEAKMVYIYNHRHGDFSDAPFGERIHVLPIIRDEKLHDVDYLTFPYYWVNENAVRKILHERNWTHKWLMGWRDVTDARASARTLIASVIPYSGVSDKFLLILPGVKVNLLVALIGNLCTIISDYIARQKVGGLHFKYFTMKQIPILPPNVYTSTDFGFIKPRVLELVYTANDLKPFAEDLGYTGEPFPWNEERRALLQAEMDVYYAKLYGLNHKQLRYILDPADLTSRELEHILDPWEEVKNPLDPAGYKYRCEGSDFPGETFRVLKDKEIRQFGEYRTRRLVLEAWNRLEGVEPAVPTITPTVQMQTANIFLQEEELGPIPKATPAIVPPPVEEKPEPEQLQPGLIDFSVYRCLKCDKMVLGYEKENHSRDVHQGRPPEWKKIR